MMRLFSVDDPDHAHATEVLPWFVNGTLDPAERSRVERHVTECAACRAELNMLYELQAIVQSDRAAAAPLEPLTAVHAEPIRPAAPLGVADRGWLRRYWGAMSFSTRALVAAQCVVIAALTGLLVGIDRAPPAAYRTLTSPPPAVRSEDTVVVVFSDATIQGAVRQLLERVHGRVVDGPNRAGALSVNVPHGQLADALRQLRASPDVRLAEPASSPALPSP